MIQVRYHFENPPRQGITRRQLVDSVWRQFQKTGRTPPGVRLTLTHWDGPPLTQPEIDHLKVGRPGLVKQYHDPALTLLDFDHSRPVSLRKIWELAEQLRIRPTWIEYDRTNRGYHVIIRWNRKFRPLETIAIQAILGSDRRRELFALARVMSGARSKRWNLLFEYKLFRQKGD